MSKADSLKAKMAKFEKEYSKKYKSPLIKWYQTELSPEEKFRFGVMTYPEYEEWMNQLAREAEEAEAATQNDGATFWANDSEQRNAISTDAYDDFLAQNGLNIDNKTTLDIDALLSEHGTKEPLPEPNLDEILAAVNRDIHGGSAILSEDEIAAMFAAANGDS